MGLRDRILEKIRKKQQELEALKLSVRETESYIQALQDTIRIVPVEHQGENVSSTETLKPGSVLAKAEAFVRKTGKPLHIIEILKGIGLPATQKSKVSLGGSLASYARKSRIFTKVAPNTFGIMGMKSELNKVPDDFGISEIDDKAIEKKI